MNQSSVKSNCLLISHILFLVVVWWQAACAEPCRGKARGVAFMCDWSQSSDTVVESVIKALDFPLIRLCYSSMQSFACNVIHLSSSSYLASPCRVAM